MSPFILGFTIKTYLTETVLLIYKTYNQAQFLDKEKIIKCFAIKNF